MWYDGTWGPLSDVLPVRAQREHRDVVVHRENKFVSVIPGRNHNRADVYKDLQGVYKGLSRVLSARCWFVLFCKLRPWVWLSERTLQCDNQLCICIVISEVTQYKLLWLAQKSGGNIAYISPLWQYMIGRYMRYFNIQMRQVILTRTVSLHCAEYWVLPRQRTIKLIVSSLSSHPLHSRTKMLASSSITIHVVHYRPYGQFLIALHRKNWHAEKTGLNIETQAGLRRSIEGHLARPCMSLYVIYLLMLWQARSDSWFRSTQCIPTSAGIEYPHVQLVVPAPLSPLCH